MKEYLMLFWNESGEGEYLTDPDKMSEAMHAWQAWIGQIASAGKLISSKPIIWEGLTVTTETKRNEPLITGEKMVTGYMLCKAESKDEIETWAEGCPILQYPQGIVEIREVAPFNL